MSARKRDTIRLLVAALTALALVTVTVRADGRPAPSNPGPALDPPVDPPLQRGISYASWSPGQYASPDAHLALAKALKRFLNHPRLR